MHDPNLICSVRSIVQDNQIDLPESPGVYAFWWIGDRQTLMKGNRQIILKGPGGCDVPVQYEDWWPDELHYPCLYVGKTTNLKKRFSLHIKRGSKQRLHEIDPRNAKAEPITSSCQLRFGIEHVFPEEADPLKLIENSVGFSFRSNFVGNSVTERFYEENRLVGMWRPWFNIDSER